MRSSVTITGPPRSIWRRKIGTTLPDELVGGGVDEDGRAVLGEHLAHPLLLLAVGQHRRQHRRRDVAFLLQLALDRKEVVLSVVEQHHAVGLEARYLATELRPDRPA